MTTFSALNFMGHICAQGDVYKLHYRQQLSSTSYQDWPSIPVENSNCAACVNN